MQYKIGTKPVSRQEFNSAVKKECGSDLSQVHIVVDEGYGQLEDTSYQSFQQMKNDGEIDSAVFLNHSIILRPNKSYWDNEYETHNQLHQQITDWD